MPGVSRTLVARGHLYRAVPPLRERLIRNKKPQSSPVSVCRYIQARPRYLASDMAPSIVAETIVATSSKTASSAVQSLRTSGQLEPEFNLIVPYEQFPKEITGPTAWKKEYYSENPDSWVHRWTTAEVQEVGRAADQFIRAGLPLTALTKESFPLPSLQAYLGAVREDIINGKGFILFKGWPVVEWGNHKAAVAYMGIGTYLGYFVSQNGRGHVLGHVKDLGEDPAQTDKVRIYRTNARQFFHSDDSDIVGLLCIARALEGGESDLVSSHHVFNILQCTRPDVVETLSRPIWRFDRKGEVSKGQSEWIRCSIFYWHDGRLYSKWDPYFVTSLERFSKAGFIPALSPEQREAIDVLEQTCLQESLHMILEVGDIQFLSNNHTFHARTAYVDHAPPAPKRHLMRLWLSTPEDEGGWKLPFVDSKNKKRGGVQVDDTPEVAPLDGE